MNGKSSSDKDAASKEIERMMIEEYIEFQEDGKTFYIRFLVFIFLYPDLHVIFDLYIFCPASETYI